MFLVLLHEQTCLLQSRVWLALHLEETSNDSANVTNIVTILLFIELELVLEQMVLLLENSDAHQSI